MSHSWRISWKKLKIKNNRLWLGLVLPIFFLVLTAFTTPNVQDRLHLVDAQTLALIRAKNNRYLQTKEQPQIVVITQRGLKRMVPPVLNRSKRRVFIVVGQKGKRRNVQLFSTKDLHAAFTADSRANIIRAESTALRSQRRATFNRGLRFVFRACATKIDQQYQYALDKYDLNSAEQDKISHPHKVALPLALGLVILVMALVFFFRHIQLRNAHQSN